MHYLYCNGEQRGPYAMEQVRSMWASGIITADTLYWNESNQEWKPVTELLAVKAESPPVPSREQSTGSSEASKVVPPPLPSPVQIKTTRPDFKEADESIAETPNTGTWDSGKPRPWRRLWAKFIDLQVLGAIPSSVVAPILFHVFSQIPISNYYLVCYWAFATAIESWLLAKFGTTPAKWLLGISVRECNGENLSSIHARQRTSSAFIRSIPLVLLFSGPLAYRDLKTKGATKWDRKNGFLVTYSSIGASRWFYAITLCVVFVLSFALGIYEVFEYAARLDRQQTSKPITIFPSTSANTSVPSVLPAVANSKQEVDEASAKRAAQNTASIAVAVRAAGYNGYWTSTQDAIRELRNGITVTANSVINGPFRIDGLPTDTGEICKYLNLDENNNLVYSPESSPQPQAQTNSAVQPHAQPSSGLHPPAQLKSDVQREFARQIAPLMFPECETSNSSLGKAITSEIARLRAADSGELHSDDAPLSITGRMADSLGIKPLMTVDDASSIVFSRWKQIRANAQPQDQPSSVAQRHDQSKFDVQREFARQIAPLLFPECENGNSPLGKAITSEIARLRAAESGELYSEDSPLSITGRMADSLGIQPLMTVDDASSIVFTRWKKIRTDAVK